MFSLHWVKADNISCIAPFTKQLMLTLISGFTTEHKNKWELSMVSPQPELHGFGFPLFDGRLRKTNTSSKLTIKHIMMRRKKTNIYKSHYPS